MCCDNITVFIICRMLNRSKFLDFHTLWKHDNTTRMLPGSPSYTGTALNNSVDFTITFMYSPLFKIILYITKSCLISQCAYGSCLKCLSFTKNNFRIFMSICLIFAGKIKVNIRFLVSFKSQESFKRNIKALFFHFGSTFRTDLIRHITSCHSGVFFYFR